MDLSTTQKKRGTGERVEIKFMNTLFKRSVWSKFIIAVCLFSLVFTPTTYALGGKFDETFYSGNDILYYNPDDKACTQSGLSSSIGSLKGNTNAEKIWNWLKSKGLSSEQAAGVMGNLQAESGFSPTRHENSKGWLSGGWGLAQWTNYPDGGATGRRTSMAKALNNQPGLGQYYDAKYGDSPPATNGGRDPGVPVEINLQLLDFELSYMMQESQGRKVSQAVASQGYGTAGANEWDTLKKQATIEAATVFWHNNFEVSADTAAAVLSVRGDFAKSAFTSFSGTSTPTSPTTSSAGTDCTSDSSSFTSGNFSETVKAYAWPTYKGRGFIQKMPAYQVAVTKAISEGRYVGADGIDCGGFITTLMLDAGFEPAYNYSGKSSAGAGATDQQTKWLNANWDNIGKGNSINTADLRPGDVAMLSGHTFVYVGPIEGFNSVIASASQDDRSPMAGKESLTASNVTWYRKKG